MARIPHQSQANNKPASKKRTYVDLRALKKAVNLQALVESRGSTLRKVNADDYVCKCPLPGHGEDNDPSFHITPSKNLFHCFGCDRGGSPMDYVMIMDGLTKAQAKDWLVEQSGGVLQRASDLEKPAPPRKKIGTENALNPGMQELLKRVVDFSQKTLQRNPSGLQYLASRKLGDAAMLEFFRVGYCDGSMSEALPKSGEVITGLKALGILLANGKERFAGRVIVPIYDNAGNITNIYGRSIDPACAPGERHMYLPGPRRGLFNGGCGKEKVYVTEAIFDSMALWQAGITTTTCVYGNNGWTVDHDELIMEAGQIYLCLDNDPPSNQASLRLKEKVHSARADLPVEIVQWPEGVKDACDFFFSRNLETFEALIQPTPAKPLPAEPEPDKQPTAEPALERIDDGFAVAYGNRRYELCAIENPSKSRLKATIKAINSDQAMKGRFYIDTIEFYVGRSRKTFLIEAARLFRQSVEVIETDMNRLIELTQSFVLKRADESAPKPVEPAADDRALGMEFGQHPELMLELVADIQKIGIKGETINGIVGYLTMTSRKMEDPIALLIVSSSGAGKTWLQDAVLFLCPEEDLNKATSLTGEALFYMEGDALKHKVLALEEHAGAENADYALRNLISAKILIKQTVVKDPGTGRMRAEKHVVPGPAAVFKTTTNPRTDAETKSRFIITTINETVAQTLLILQAQRTRHTIEGKLAVKQREEVARRHHAFQRMLKPIMIINRFESLLTYGEESLSARRENPKYLNIIVTLTFLHQMQRPIQHHPQLGDYIETTLDDLAYANELGRKLLGHSLDELSGPGRRLLVLLIGHVKTKAERLKVPSDKVEITRKELRDAFGWGEHHLRTHMDELAELEYVIKIGLRQGQTFRYRLPAGLDLDHAQEPRIVRGLKSVEQLRKEAIEQGILTPFNDFQTSELLREKFLSSLSEVPVEPELRGEKENFVVTSPESWAKLENHVNGSEQEDCELLPLNFVVPPGELIRSHQNGAVHLNGR